MPTVTEAIRNFLTNTPHNAPEFITRWSPAMETQVNVAAGVSLYRARNRRGKT